MFIRRKKYPSGNVGIIVTEKINGKMNELATIGIAKEPEDLDSLMSKAREWIEREQERRHPVWIFSARSVRGVKRNF